jgi:RNA polymerase sigma factor (sigma-70 family)
MNCQEITQVPVALEIMKGPQSREYQQLFRCIYELFQGSFINWIFKKYSNISSKEKLLNDAKDAFQMGMMKMVEKSRQNGLIINGSLKTTVYSYGLLQLLAKVKQEKSEEKRRSGYLTLIDLLIEDDSIIKEIGDVFDEREKALLKALNELPEKRRQILIMAFYDKLRSKEIGGKLGVSSGNVDNEKTKAYKALREILKSKSIA